MIKVSPRARRHDDKAGDPLDGLVNLFDLGIVLSVGFLLAALSSLNLASTFTQGGSSGTPDGSISVPSDSQVSQVPTDGETVIGQGEQVGTVYRLSDGRLVYVLPPSGAPAPLTPGATEAPAPPRPTLGFVLCRHELVNQTGAVVFELQNTAMFLTRVAA